MSKKNELAQLSKRLPSSDEIDQIMDELRSGSDIAAAITGAAIVEARLEMLIRSKLHSRRESLPALLFDNRGPLSDFNSKIVVAEAFGHITPATAEELHIIRAVRNAFAHSKVNLTFSHAAVERKARSFSSLKAIEGTLPSIPSTKGAFILIVRLLLIIFDTLEEFSGTAHEAISAALKDSDAAVIKRAHKAVDDERRD